MSALLRATLKDSGALSALTRLRQLGESPRALLAAMANYGESSTRARFKSQTGPDGAAWKKSRRAIKQGGQTLRFTGRLERSISSHATGSFAEWGTNVAYAGIHQFGGVIERLTHSRILRLRTTAAGRLLRQKDHANLSVFAKTTHKRATERRATIAAYKINMPARPYLGVNDADRGAFADLAMQVVAQAAGAGSV